MDGVELLGGLTAIVTLLVIMLIVQWIVLPLLVDAIRGHVKALRREMQVQNSHLKAIREALEKQARSG